MHTKFFYAVALGTLMLAGGHARITVAQIKAPSLPSGSDKIVVQLGEDPSEDARGKSAHKQKQKKNKGASEASPNEGGSTGSSKNGKSVP